MRDQDSRKFGIPWLVMIMCLAGKKGAWMGRMDATKVNGKCGLICAGNVKRAGWHIPWV